MLKIKDLEIKKKPLLEKYNVPVPRYTSYPTVPYWNKETIDEENWKLSVKNSFDKTNKQNGIAIYIHLPYCESICTFCGCNKRITKNHTVEKPYIETILKEWEIYQKIFNEKPIIKELHLGGGTPTFFSPDSLKTLIKGILKNSELATNYEFSLEVHPNVTTEEHIKTLYELGFRRISIGVQDFDPYVQTMINRVQSFEQVKFINDISKKYGFTSINFDLVYGLPFQKEESIINTVNKVKELMPDRIAFYSYAHVPWKSAGQRRYTESDLPSAEYKRKLYETGRTLLEENGYSEIGMDHFSLKTDKLYKSMKNETMHRNFMGYTDNYTELLIGLGVSSISDTWNGFMQNNKVIEEYMESINSGKLAISEGHILNEEDMIIRRHILNLMCHFKTEFNKNELYIQDGIKRISELENDELVIVKDNIVSVTELGKTFIRNICMCLDNRLWSKTPSTQLFSKAI